ncbi:MAG: dTDP-4-dehydrorhamnose reductase [Prevotellaceae bacterium]|nr:dTDP-4-dehydrorhamnose reductase [Prevotellaceae bacterium]
MNILVTGANGQLGNEMRIVAKNSMDNYIFTDVCQSEEVETVYLDITDPDAVRAMVQKHDVRAIVNCAAWTNVDAAEAPENYPMVEKLNAVAPGILATAMKEAGGWLVHISTDYVFGKEPYNTPCRPDQKGTPTGIYGETKRQGEEKIKEVFGISQLSDGRQSGNNEGKGGYIIIRTAWLYSEFGKNFCKTMLQLTATKPQLRVVFDQCGTPTYALDLAKAILVILAKPVSGTYHFSNEGVCSWYDFTQMIARIAGNKDCDVQPCYSTEFPSPVVRPAYSVLDKRSIRETFGVEVPYWVDSLKTCIANIKQNQWK